MGIDTFEPEGSSLDRIGDDSILKLDQGWMDAILRNYKNNPEVGINEIEEKFHTSIPLVGEPELILEVVDDAAGTRRYTINKTKDDRLIIEQLMVPQVSEDVEMDAELRKKYGMD